VVKKSGSVVACKLLISNQYYYHCNCILGHESVALYRKYMHEE